MILLLRKNRCIVNVSQSQIDDYDASHEEVNDDMEQVQGVPENVSETDNVDSKGENVTKNPVREHSLPKCSHDFEVADNDGTYINVDY